MEKLMKQLTLKIKLEVNRMADLEFLYMEAVKSDDKETKEVILDEFAHLGSNVKELIVGNASTNIDEIYSQYCEKVLQIDLFKEIARNYGTFARMTDRIKHKIKDTILTEIPDKILNIMDALAYAKRKPQDLMGDQFELRYFVSQFLVAMLAENESLLAMEELNKKELYERVYGGYSEKEGIFEKIVAVQKDYPSIFPAQIKDVTYETAKKRMQEMLPSKHKSHVMDQSHYLNIYEQHALLIQFLIYSTRYRRFLSNPNSKNVKVPEYEIFEEVREAVEDLFTLEPLSEMPSELFIKSIIEDTLHTRLFNAVTLFIMEVIQEFLTLMKVMSEHDTLSTLFVLDQMIADIPKITKTWTEKYQEIIDEIDLLSQDEGVKESVRRAIDNEDSISFARKNLLKLFDKYSTIYKNEFAKEETEDEENAAKEIFKHIVKLFYQTGDGEIAYRK